MTALSRGLASQYLRAFLASRSAGIVMVAALAACPTAAPPSPGDSRGVPAAPPASSKPPSALPQAQQPAPPRPGYASTVNLDGLLPLICFGNEPFWGIQFKADGSATCEAMCEGPPSLRIANLSRTPSGDPQGFDLLDAQGGLFLHGTLRRTGQCSDGMSDNVHPYVFTATGKRGPLQGCCRDKRVKLSSG
jgi:uncharacterized membrane protein